MRKVQLVNLTIPVVSDDPNEAIEFVKESLYYKEMDEGHLKDILRDVKVIGSEIEQ